MLKLFTVLSWTFKRST